jgi:hypothetical protein
MSTVTRTILMLAFAAATALPAEAQSANRSSAPTVAAPSSVGRFVETTEQARCRHHCASFAASAPHRTVSHHSVAERQLRNERCSKKMIHTRPTY